MTDERRPTPARGQARDLDVVSRTRSVDELTADVTKQNRGRQLADWASARAINANTDSAGDQADDSATAKNPHKAPPENGKPPCKGRRKDGQLCRSTLTDGDGFCVQHSPTKRFDPRESGRKGGLKSGETKRKRAKTGRDFLREKVEANSERIWRVYSEALDSETPDGRPDVRARYQAAGDLLNQALGRPVSLMDEAGTVQLIVEGRPPREAVVEDAGETPGPVMPLRAVEDAGGDAA